MSIRPCRYSVTMTIPLKFGLVCETNIRIGMVSPGKAPCLSKSTVAVIILPEEDVVVERLSLAFTPDPVVVDGFLTTWKLWLLVVVVEAMVSSLGAGLRGGATPEGPRAIGVLTFVFIRI